MLVVEKVGLKMEKSDVLFVFMYQVRGTWYTEVCVCTVAQKRTSHGSPLPFSTVSS